MFEVKPSHSFSRDRENALQQRKNELCSEMLNQLLNNNDVEIKINSPERRNELSALLAGKWAHVDMETSDLFSKKILGTRVSDWSARKLQGNASIYKVRYDENSTYNTWYAKQQSNMIAQAALCVGVAVGIIGIIAISLSLFDSK